MNDLTVIYYTSNYLEEKNPYFLHNCQMQLLEAIDHKSLIIVSQKPTNFAKDVGWKNVTENIVMEGIGRSHLNIYRQILAGAKAAKTRFVAMAEDDILYSPEHFDFEKYIKNPQDDVFYYDMNKVSLFTWTIPVFSFRFKREVVNQLICNRELLIESLEERFRRVDELKEKYGWPEEKIIKYFGDPGRYEELLGVTPRKTQQVSCSNPSIVFSHEHAFGYENNQGKKKRLGDLRIVELYGWGKATEILKLYDENL